MSMQMLGVGLEYTMTEIHPRRTRRARVGTAYIVENARLSFVFCGLRYGISYRLIG